MKHLLSRIKAFAKANKAISALFAVAILSALYGGFKKTDASTQAKYVLADVSRGTVISTVSGTGTVSSENQIDLKAEVSGTVNKINVKAGDAVSQGDTLVSLDAQDAYNAYRASQIAYEKVTEPADASSLSSAQSALVSAQTSESTAYNSAIDDTSSMFLDVPTIIDGLENMFNTDAGYLSSSNVRYVGDVAVADRDAAASQLYLTHQEFTSLNDEYKAVTRTSATSTVEKLINDAYSVTKDLAQSLKETKTAVDYVKANTSSSESEAGTAAQTSVATWTDQAATHLSALLADESAMQTSRLSVVDKEAALEKVASGADPLDVQSAALDLETKRDAYEKSFIAAPFTGIVGKVDVNLGDSVSNGSVIATVITKQQTATISLNEVDAAKVKTGDKATMTFDAVDGLTLTGVVSEIDLVGTVSQGVVTYNAKIAFDASDDRVLPGMSVSADIITDSKTDVLSVPSSAVKTAADGSSYVLVFTPPLPQAAGNAPVASALAPTQVPVAVGLAGDTTTEIISGLSEGQEIVTRTVSSAAAAPAAQAPSLFGGGGNRTGGGATRALGR